MWTYPVLGLSSPGSLLLLPRSPLQSFDLLPTGVIRPPRHHALTDLRRCVVVKPLGGACEPANARAGVTTNRPRACVLRHVVPAEERSDKRWSCGVRRCGSKEPAGRTAGTAGSSARASRHTRAEDLFALGRGRKRTCCPRGPRSSCSLYRSAESSAATTQATSQNSSTNHTQQRHGCELRLPSSWMAGRGCLQAPAGCSGRPDSAGLKTQPICQRSPRDHKRRQIAWGATVLRDSVVSWAASARVAVPPVTHKQSLRKHRRNHKQPCLWAYTSRGIDGSFRISPCENPWWLSPPKKDGSRRTMYFSVETSSGYL